MKEHVPPPEFSRLFPVDKLRDRPVRERIEATPAECAALAKRMNLAALKSLEGDVTLTRAHSGPIVEVSGRLEAKVVQNCVVTLEPFETDISEKLQAFFAPPAIVPKGVDVPLEDEHAPDPIGPKGEIDIGELVAQHLSLALDPYPRKPDAVFEAVEEEVKEEKPSPFAVLADIRAAKAPKKGK